MRPKVKFCRQNMKTCLQYRIPKSALRVSGGIRQKPAAEPLRFRMRWRPPAPGSRAVLSPVLIPYGGPICSRFLPALEHPRGGVDQDSLVSPAVDGDALHAVAALGEVAHDVVGDARLGADGAAAGVARQTGRRRR